MMDGSTTLPKDLLILRPFSSKTKPWVRTVLLSGKKAIITRETIAQSSRYYTYHNKKSIQELSFQYTPLEKTIADTANEFLKSKRGEKWGALSFWNPNPNPNSFLTALPTKIKSFFLSKRWAEQPFIQKNTDFSSSFDH